MKRTLISLTVALALTTPAVAYAETTPPPAPTTSAVDSSTTTLTGGTFAWPIKTSFISYVRGPLAKGEITTTEGATFADNQFVFPVDPKATAVDQNGNGTIGLLGTIHIVAHKNFQGPGKHGLDLTYSNLTLVTAGRTVTLKGDYTVGGTVGGKQGSEVDNSGHNVPLITFTLAQPINPGTDVNLIDADSYVAQGLVDSLKHYEVGQKLDASPVDLILDYDNGHQPGDPTPNDLGSSAAFSVEMGNNPGAFAGIIIGVLAALGLLSAGIGWAVQHLLPGLPLP
ncbi:MAG: HtaA domain-containing protein [Corynebacterium glucuronolyticum]|nr:HtaA domain-containing protein [Corynebacterium glucuronolyticum]